MRITIDTEKDSKEDIQTAIQLLKKIAGLTEEQREETRQETPNRNPETLTAEELLKRITSGKLVRSSPPSEEIKGVPKSIREAYDIAEKLDTY